MHLRIAIEKLKNYYIVSLIKSGLTDPSEDELKALTITDLQDIYNSISK